MHADIERIASEIGIVVECECPHCLSIQVRSSELDAISILAEDEGWEVPCSVGSSAFYLQCEV